jgi:hypothetical protein
MYIEKMSQESFVQKDISKSKIGTGIDRIIVDAERYALSGEDILRIADGKCVVISYEDLHNLETLDSILDPYDAAVILYQTTELFGHWIALLRKGDRIEFYDSYGLKPDEELNLQNAYHKRIHEGKIVPHLSHLLRQDGYRVVYNSERLQENLEDVNSCGRYAALRVRLRNFGMNKFNSLLTKNHHYSSDFWVSALTLLI